MRLTLRGVDASYEPDVPAISGIDLSVKEGERMVLLGPSGSGKTTTLRLVAGLQQPDRGDILFDDESVVDVPAERRGAAMVFQQDTLFPYRTIAENVEYGLRVRRVPRRERQERVAAALAGVHLDHLADRWPDELSGGQRQRIALARALVVRPRILLLDEPLGSLEPTLREELAGLICSIQREAGITTVFVTHDQREAATVADRIAVMIGGRIRQVGSPQDLYQRPVDLDVARFFGSHNVFAGTKAGSVVHSALGDLTVDEAGGSDGPVLLTIRPDAIDLADTDDGGGANDVTGTVERCRFVGVAVDCTIDVGGTALRVLAPPTTPERAPGDRLTVRIPPDRIRLMAVDEPERWRNDAEIGRTG